VGAFINRYKIFNMQEPVQKTKLHQKAYHHIRKHKKNYVRIVSFFIFLVIYSVIEDMIAVTIHGVEFDMDVFVIALVFTGIAEITERLYKKEESEIKEYEKKVEKVIKKEEDFLEDEEKIIERKIKGKK
jgi:steroid 5-alpha reductase family enzyme